MDQQQPPAHIAAMNNVLVAGFSHPIVSDNDLASETSRASIGTVHSNRFGSEIAGTLIDLMVNGPERGK